MNPSVAAQPFGQLNPISFNPVTTPISNPGANSIAQQTFGGSTQTTTPSMGVQAKSPNTNLTPPSNTLTSSQTAPSSNSSSGLYPSLMSNQVGTPQSTAPVVNTPSATNPTSNPNFNYNAGVTANTAAPATSYSNAGFAGNGTAPTTSTTNSSTPLTQQGIYQQLLNQLNTYQSQESGLTSQEQGLASQMAAANAGILNSPGELGYQTGRQAQLQQTYNTGLGALQQNQAQLANYESPIISALTSAGGQLGPQQQAVTPPAGGVTTIANTGQQYSNPIYEPASGAYNALSPQPNGTPGTPSTAGQASTITIQPGQTLDQIAAQYGTTATALAQANGIANPNDIQAGASLTIPSSTGTNTPFAGGVASGQAALGTQYAQNYSAYQQSEGIRQNIDSIIQANPNLNPSVFTNVNSALQFLNGQVSNPAYAILANNVAEYVNTLAPILGVGGDTTNYKTALAQQFLNGAASGQNMQQILAGIAQTASVKLQQQQTAGGSTGTVTPTNPTSATGSTNGSLYAF